MLHDYFFETVGKHSDNGVKLSYWQRIAGFEETDQIKNETNFYNKFNIFQYIDSNNNQVLKSQDDDKHFL